VLQDRIKELGGIYQKVDDWHPLAVTDGKLVTGQNHGSSTVVAEAVVKLLA